MFGGGEVDRKTAEIVLLERIEGEREPGPVEAGAGAAHGVEGELGGDVGFELEDLVGRMPFSPYLRRSS